MTALLPISSAPIKFGQNQEEAPVGNRTFEFTLDLTFVGSLALAYSIVAGELSDRELLAASERSFEFWNNPQDDVYNDLLNE